MTEALWNKFDKQFGKDVVQEDVPLGFYEVEVDKMELGETKAGKPALKIQYRIREGAYANRVIFQTQVITHKLGAQECEKILTAMTKGNVDVNFESFSQFGQLVMDIYEALQGKFGFDLEYTKEDDYPRFNISGRFKIGE